MKKNITNIALIVIAEFLSIVLFVPGVLYTAIYYINHEEQKRFSYGRRIAFIKDVKGNCLYGEFFERIFVKKEFRGIHTFFGDPVSISSAIGHVLIKGWYKKGKLQKWFLNALNTISKQPQHCEEAFVSEIKDKGLVTANNDKIIK